MVYNKSRSTVLARFPRRAEGFFERLLGLMGRKTFPRGGDALVFDNCDAIHCCFMRMEIDAVFVDRQGRAVKCFHSLKPWRFAFGGSRSCAVIELPPGTLRKSRTEPGDELLFD